MDKAKSMYSGGKTVEAQEIRDYEESRNLGLICLECEREVFLKKTKSGKPHFSHYKESEHDDKCPFRVPQSRKNKDNLLDMSNDNENGKGQRLEFYEQHLLDIISESYKDFNQITKFSFSYFTNNEIEKQCEIFRDKQRLVIRSLGSTDRELATKEVINYIGKESKLHLLKQIIAYAMYKNKSKNDKQFSFYVRNLLQHIDWLYFLTNSNQFRKQKDQDNEPFYLKIKNSYIEQKDYGSGKSKNQQQISKKTDNIPKINEYDLLKPCPLNLEYHFQEEKPKRNNPNESQYSFKVILVIPYFKFEKESDYPLQFIFNVYVKDKQKDKHIAEEGYSYTGAIKMNENLQFLQDLPSLPLTRGSRKGEVLEIGTHISDTATLICYCIDEFDKESFVDGAVVKDCNLLILSEFKKMLQARVDYKDNLAVTEFSKDSIFQFLENCYNKIEKTVGKKNAHKTFPAKLKNKLNLT